MSVGEHMMRAPHYYVSLLFNGTAVWASSCLLTRDKLPGNCALIGWLSTPSGQWHGHATRRRMRGKHTTETKSVRKFAVKSRKYPGWVCVSLKSMSKGLFEHKNSVSKNKNTWAGHQRPTQTYSEILRLFGESDNKVTFLWKPSSMLCLAGRDMPLQNLHCQGFKWAYWGLETHPSGNNSCLFCCSCDVRSCETWGVQTRSNKRVGNA